MEQSIKISHDSQAILESIVAGISSLAYVVDLDTFELIYTSKVLNELWGDRLVDRKCYEVFNLAAPCLECSKWSHNKDDSKFCFWERYDPIYDHYYLVEKKPLIGRMAGWPDRARWFCNGYHSTAES